MSFPRSAVLKKGVRLNKCLKNASISQQCKTLLGHADKIKAKILTREKERIVLVRRLL